MERERAERLAREEEKLVISENERRESEAKTIRGTIIAIFAIVLITMITAALWTKPWETSNPTIANKSGNQSVNNAANKVSNIVSNQPVNIPTNVSSTPVNAALVNLGQVNKSQNVNSTLVKKPTPNSAQNPTPIQSPQTSTSEITYYCGAQTKSGRMCPRLLKGGGRCWQHKGQPALLPQEKLKVS